MLVVGIRKLLIADAGFIALVGTPATRADKRDGLFAVRAEDDAIAPYAVYTQISGTGEADTLQGANAFQQARIQFSNYGKTYLDAKRLARAVKNALVGYRGVLVDGTQIDAVTLLLETDGYEEDPKLFNVPIDIEISFGDVGTS